MSSKYAMPTAEEKNAHVISVFLIICGGFGLFCGVAGMGVALILLTLQQSIGVGLTVSGIGALFGATIGCRLVMRGLILALKDVERERRN